MLNVGASCISSCFLSGFGPSYGESKTGKTERTGGHSGSYDMVGDQDSTLSSHSFVVRFQKEKR
jgi:hypothetical protein